MLDCLFNLANNILLFYKSISYPSIYVAGRLNKTKNNFNKYFCIKSINLADLF